MIIVIPEKRICAVDQMDAGLDMLRVLQAGILKYQGDPDLVEVQSVLGTVLNLLSPARELCNGLPHDDRVFTDGRITR